MNKTFNFTDNYISIHQENARIINIAGISCFLARMSHGGKKSTTAPPNFAELCGVILTYIFNLHRKKICKNIKGVISDDGLTNSIATSESKKRIKYEKLSSPLPKILTSKLKIT